VLYALIDRPSGPCNYQQIFGPNMAVRRTVFETGMRFAEHLGPDSSNDSYPMGSEWEFTRRLYRSGHRGWFEQGARVRHMVRPEQLTEDWMIARAYRNGLGTGLMASQSHHASRPTRPAPDDPPQAVLARRALWRCLAILARLLPPSRLRLRARFRDRWYAGLAAANQNRAAIGRGGTADSAVLLAPDIGSA
jgi:hypothetical protein